MQEQPMPPYTNKRLEEYLASDPELTSDQRDELRGYFRHFVANVRSWHPVYPVKQPRETYN